MIRVVGPSLSSTAQEGVQVVRRGGAVERLQNRPDLLTGVPDGDSKTIEPRLSGGFRVRDEGRNDQGLSDPGTIATDAHALLFADHPSEEIRQPLVSHIARDVLDALEHHRPRPLTVGLRQGGPQDYQRPQPERHLSEVIAEEVQR